ncbi:MAG: HD domain-containing phosphohydrolase [Acholeplasmataceae bacterium]
MTILIGLSENIIALSQNALYLLLLAFIYSLTNVNPYTRRQSTQILIGIAIGLSLILIMSTPSVIEEGLFFDTRTILLSLSGVFFGLVPTAIGGLFAIVYRIFVGGAGVYTGIATITLSALIGIAWPRIRQSFRFKKKYIEYLVFGYVVHIGALACFLLIPWPRAFEIIRISLIPYLTIFPVVTTVIALSIERLKGQFEAHYRIEQQEILLKASIDSTKQMEVYAIDLEGRYMTFNRYHEQSMKNYYGAQIRIGDSFFDYIDDERMKTRLKRFIQEAYAGKEITKTFEVEVKPGKYLEEYYAPIKDKDQQVIGVTVFSHDVSESVRNQENMRYISYHDDMTGLKNRRFYMEDLEVIKEEETPVVVILIDVNGLKVMNDSFGHEQGDRLLLIVARKLKETFDPDASEIYRIGGDEFSIIMPYATEKEANDLIERVKQDLASVYIKGMSISISYGIALKDGDRVDILETIRIAENNMYKHKLFEIASHRNKSIQTILNTLREKNPREEEHSERVSALCRTIGDLVGMSKYEIQQLEMVSNLHDIGKIGIDEAILNKAGKLTDEEWSEIRRHPEIGYRILSSSPDYADVAKDILAHHERYDGTGYPRGIKGEDIPIKARIISIADAYDAMISDRPYRKAMSKSEALREIERNAGTQFDPKIARLFIEYLKKNSDET